jgi:CubicO group peptidase (beta-lactamase class C family)
VLVAKDGQPVFRRGYGLANSEWDIPNTPETKFRLGSITKQFTAASILQLVEAGKVSIDDPISKYYPDAPTAWEKVTIYHLLTHTSGIPSYTSLPDFFPTAKSRTRMTPAEIVKLTQDKPLEFAPGEKMLYDNTGYILLGIVIEKASGQPYAAYLDQHIFKPAGMADSGYDSAETLIKRRASGYLPNGTNAPFLEMTLPYAAGSLYSTVDDLLKWSIALEGDKLLKQGSKARMATPFKNNYAFGLVINKIAGKPVQAHGGGINGFNTHLIRFPEERVTIVTLANQNGPAADQIANGLARMYFGEKVEPRALRTEVKLPPEKLDALAGEYQLNPNMVLKIWREGDRMITQATNQGQLTVIAIGETRLYAKQPDAELEFQLDENGKAKSLTLHQNGQHIPAAKVQ